MIKVGGSSYLTKKTHPQVGNWQSFPETGIDQVDQVLPVGRNEGAVVWSQTHRLGLLVTHAISRVEPHHVARVGLVQGHQVELEREDVDQKDVEELEKLGFTL